VRPYLRVYALYRAEKGVARKSLFDIRLRDTQNPVS